MANDDYDRGKRSRSARNDRGDEGWGRSDARGGYDADQGGQLAERDRDVEGEGTLDRQRSPAPSTKRDRYAGAAGDDVREREYGAGYGGGYGRSGGYGERGGRGDWGGQDSGQPASSDRAAWDESSPYGGYGDSSGYATGAPRSAYGAGRGYGGREPQRGAANHAGRGPRNYRRSDQRIEEDVNEALTRHPHLDATDVEVSVREGEVTLTGRVDSRQAKRMAEDAADSVSGVRDVSNQLRIAPQGAAAGDREVTRAATRDVDESSTRGASGGDASAGSTRSGRTSSAKGGADGRSRQAGGAARKRR